MKGIEKLVPGFNHALKALPGAHAAWHSLQASLEEQSFLPAHSSALVAVVAAQRLGDEYANWVMQRLAANEGIDSETLLLASAGTSLDPCLRTVVKAAWAILSGERLPQTLECPTSHAMLLGERGSEEIAAHVALAILCCRVLQALSPCTTLAAQARRSA